MAVSLTISTPSSGFTADVDAVVDDLYTLPLSELRELVDVEFMLGTLGPSATDATIAAALVNIGTWSAYASAGARETAVAARRATLDSLRV